MAGKKHNATPARSAASASASKAQRAAKAAREPAASASPSAGDAHGMIAEAAYYKAASRGFSPGYELQDWLEAEREVHGGDRV